MNAKSILLMRPSVARRPSAVTRQSEDETDEAKKSSLKDLPANEAKEATKGYGKDSLVMNYEMTMLVNKFGDTTLRTTLRAFCARVIMSAAFNVVVVFVILINSVILLATNDDADIEEQFSWTSQLYEWADIACIAFFTWEAMMKLYAARMAYFHYNYNVFDFVILVTAYLERIIELFGKGGSALALFRMFRCVRIFQIMRAISFLQGLQLLISALFEVLLTSIVTILLVLLMWLFIFAVIGYYFFGLKGNAEVKYYFGRLDKAMLTLFSFITVDNWLPIHKLLVKEFGWVSMLFTMLFVFVGHFIMTNIFVAIIILFIDSAKKKETEQKFTARSETASVRNAIMNKKHKRQLDSMIKAEGMDAFEKFSRKFIDLIPSSDVSVHHDLCLNLHWINLFHKCLIRMDHSNEQLMFLYHEMISKVLIPCLNDDPEKLFPLKQAQNRQTYHKLVYNRHMLHGG